MAENLKRKVEEVKSRQSELAASRAKERPATGRRTADIGIGIASGSVREEKK